MDNTYICKKRVREIIRNELCNEDTFGIRHVADAKDISNAIYEKILGNSEYVVIFKCAGVNRKNFYNIVLDVLEHVNNVYISKNPTRRFRRDIGTVKINKPRRTKTGTETGTGTANGTDVYIFGINYDTLA